MSPRPTTLNIGLSEMNVYDLVSFPDHFLPYRENQVFPCGKKWSGNETIYTLYFPVLIVPVLCLRLSNKVRKSSLALNAHTRLSLKAYCMLK